MSMITKAIVIRLGLLLPLTSIAGCEMAKKPSNLNNNLSQDKATSIIDSLNKKSKVENLYAIEITEGEVTFSAMSNGCTKQSHFKLLLGDDIDGKSELAIIRLKQDMCRMKSHLKSFTLKNSELTQSKQFKVLNLLKFKQQ